MVVNAENLLVSVQGEKYHDVENSRADFGQEESPTALISQDATQLCAPIQIDPKCTKFQTGPVPGKECQENKTQTKNELLNLAGLFLTAICMGLLFGAAMERGKVTPPITIRKQFIFQRFVMLKMFLSASAFGSICFLFLSIVLPTRCEPVRAKFMSSKATTGMVPVVLGTFLLGCGMTVAGSCPGMVYIQLGAGVENAIITLLGGMAGAMSYGLVQPYLASFLAIGRCKQQKLDDLDMLAGVKYWQLAPALPAFLAIAIGLFEHYFPWDSPSELGAAGNATYAAWSQAWAPELSGVLIGSLQLPAVLVAGGTVGSSSTYMVVVAQVLATPSLQDHFKHLNGFRSGPSMWQSVLYIWSAALGAYIAASAGGTFASSRGVPPGPAFIGGFLMLFGSRFSPPTLSPTPAFISPDVRTCPPSLISLACLPAPCSVLPALSSARARIKQPDPQRTAIRAQPGRPPARDERRRARQDGRGVHERARPVGDGAAVAAVDPGRARHVRRRHRHRLRLRRRRPRGVPAPVKRALGQPRLLAQLPAAGKIIQVCGSRFRPPLPPVIKPFKHHDEVKASLSFFVSLSAGPGNQP